MGDTKPVVRQVSYITSLIIYISEITKRLYLIY